MKLAIYDFDGTYMKSQVLRLIFKFWKEQGLNMKKYKKVWRTIMWRYLLHKYNLFGWNKRSFRANAMALTVELFKSVDRDILDKFLNDLYIHLQEYVNQDMKKQLQKDKEEGFYTILLSGNFDIILAPFLNEGFDEVIGSEVLVNGELVSPSEVEIIIHDIKAVKIKEKFPEADYKNSKAYADSDYDLPILEIVGIPIVVNPDETLLNIAKERHYKIFEKEKTI